MELPCILQRLVVVAESLHNHAVDAGGILYLYVEIAHHVAGEVVSCQLEQHLVFIHGIGFVGYHEHEVGIAFGRELASIDAVAVVEHRRTAFPDVAQIEVTTAQTPARLHSLHYHSRHFADFTLRIFLHDGLHIGKASVGVAFIKLAQSAHKDEPVAVGSQRETGLGNVYIALHLAVSRRLEGFVSAGIERVFNMNTKLCVLLEVGVGEQYGPRIVGIITFQFAHISVGDIKLALARIEKEEVIEHIGHLFEVGITVGESAEMLLAERKIIEFIFEYHSRIEESILYYLVTCLHLVLGERYLRHVILTAMRIVLRTIGELFERVSLGFNLRYGVELGFREFLCIGKCHHSLVHTLPVVNVFALSPLFLERSFTLAYGDGIIEIPCGVAFIVSVLIQSQTVTSIGIHRQLASVLRHCLLRVEFGLLLLLFFFLLFQCFYHTVDGGITVLFIHFGKCLQRVLQVYGIGVRHQFVEDG